MRKYRVAIIEPSTIIAQGLASLLGSCDDFELVNVSRSLRSWVEFGAVRPTDLVIIGSQALGGLTQPLRVAVEELQGVTVVLLSTTVCDEEVLRWVDGVVNIYDDGKALVRKLRVALDKDATNQYSDSHDLSERERDVLILVAKGLANKEIADRLNISIHTVMSHRKNITHKTGIKSVAGLTVYALLNNLLDQSDVEMA